MLTHNKHRITLIVVTIIGLLSAFPAQAISEFLDAWRDIYPASNSDDIGGSGCQLCHVSPVGNQPWNSYGWNIRLIYRTTLDIDFAIQTVSDKNIDNDPSGANSIDEIINHYQPGWVEGAVNTVYGIDALGDPVLTMNQSPPSISGNSTKNDPAAPTINTLLPIQEGNIAIELETIADDFSDPVMAARAPGLSDFLFVVEQSGQIWRVDLADGSRVLFHDVSVASGVSLVSSGERGLLGLAFDPDYLTNGYFYTYQSESNTGAANADFSTMPDVNNANHQTVISEWMTINPESNDSFSVLKTRRVVLTIDQPQENHNGGMLNFGPDGFLYIALGDGGSSNDVGTGHGLNGNSRDNLNPLGSILRINPQGNNSDNNEYGIPNDNPFVGTAGLDEIYAYGFRNPYRFSFDSLCFADNQTCNTLMLGDVGQGEVEEVNRVISGGNYGWNWKEGSFFFYPSTSSIYEGETYISLDPPPGLPNNLIDPIAEYKNSSADGLSVIGGYIYRGSAIPQLKGRYVFGDYANRLYYLDANDQIRRFRTTSNVNLIAGFGEDDEKELYVVSRSSTGGKLHKLVASDSGPDPLVDNDFCLPIKATNGNIALICL